MITVYKRDSTKTAPVPVKCAEFRVGLGDENGDTIYHNTHFATEQEAWNALMDDQEAGLRIAGREVRRIRDNLVQAEKRLADEAALWTETRDNFRKWMREQASAQAATVQA